jgi:hypothetical protein
MHYTCVCVCLSVSVSTQLLTVSSTKLWGACTTQVCVYVLVSVCVFECECIYSAAVCQLNKAAGRMHYTDVCECECLGRAYQVNEI